MKKLFTLFAIAALFAACSDDDDPTPVSFSIDWPEKISFSPGEVQTFDFTATGDYTLELTAPKAWLFTEEADQTLRLTAPATDASDAEFDGKVTITAYDGSTVAATFTTDVLTLITVTFEDVPAQYLAGPTAYGENLYEKTAYNSYDGEQFTNYTDPASGLVISVPYDLGYPGFSGFALGGAAISRWNDMTTEGYKNQCSVYYSDAVSGKGGHNGSATFSLVFVPTFMGPGYEIPIALADDKEAVFDHFYISNSTYTTLSMRNGDGWAKAFNYEDKDWFLLTLTGINAQGEPVGEPIDYYLADFRTADSPGILEGWHKVDLSSLGKINRVEFKMSSTDGEGTMTNTPCYFCIDDIAIRK